MDDWPIIFSYTRAQAIADGVLIDVTAQAAEVGFKVHTVVTDHLYNMYVVPPAGLEGEGQSVTGRLQDLLFRTLIAASTMERTDRVEYVVLFLMKPGQWEKVRILAIMGPGDQREPVLTIMLPGDE